MKVLTVLGARPQFIKAAAVSREFAHQGGVREVLVHTGQHYDDNMSDIFFRELGLPEPGYHLGIGSSSHSEQTGRMLQAVERALLNESPDWVLVYGDTNSTLAGALAAAKLCVPIAHVEAGLRSFNRRMPEEVNRVLTDHLSTLLFAPTPTASANLVKEGMAADSIRLVGDVMYDCALHFGGNSTAAFLQAMNLAPRGFVLATIHRAENTDDPTRLEAILRAISALAAEVPVLCPLHPRTRKIVLSRPDLAPILDGVRVVDPLGYLDMVAAEKEARVILTDSGGVQKEAFFHRTPCVTVREETEWTELVELGWNQLASPRDASAIMKAVLEAARGVEPPTDLYGGGQASKQIVAQLRGNPR